MRLPVTIISGHLGAGKTTLINRLLTEAHGLKLAVIVNDFGAINIDDALIAQAGGDTVALSNGCICCSIGDDLALALRQVLARPQLPDHIVIEASGVSDPVSIANSVLNDNALSYGGIVTLVDAENAPDLLADAMLAAPVEHQIRAADLVLVTKAHDVADGLKSQLREIGARTPVVLGDMPVAELLFDLVPLPKGRATQPHPAYAVWHHRSADVLDRRDLGDKLASRPEGLYRMKGFVLTTGGAYELQVVGRNVKAVRCDAEQTELVALGPACGISAGQIEAWWNG